MAEINIDIKLMTDKLQRAAREAQKSLQSIQKAAQESNNSIQKNTKQSTAAWETFKGVLGANVVVGAFRTISGAIGDFSKGFVKAASSIEDITAEFSSLTGGIENAQELLNDLTEFAAKTPFQLPGLAAASKTLLAFGFEQDQIIEKLQVLGDVAAVTGRDVKDIATIFGQVSAAGKLTGERLNQLQEAGIPVLKTLADQLGTTQGTVRELVSKGKIDFRTFEKAFNSLNQKGGIAFEGLQNRSETLSGAFSTLQDNIFLLQADVGKELNPILKEAVKEFTTLIQNNKELIIGFSKSLIPVIKRATNSFIDLVKHSASFLSGLSSASFSGIISEFENVIIVVNLLAGAFKAVNKLIDVLAGAAAGAAAVIFETFAVLGSPSGIVGIFKFISAGIAEIFVDIANSAVGVASAISEIFGGAPIKSQILEGLLASLDEIKTSAIELNSPFADTIAQLKGFEKAANAAVEAALPKTFNEVQVASENAAKSVKTLGKDLKELPKSASTDIKLSVDEARAAAGIRDQDLLTKEQLKSIKETEKARQAAEDAVTNERIKASKELQKLEEKRIDQAVGLAASVLGAGSGEQGGQRLITQGGALAADAFFPGSGQIVGPLLDILSQGPEATKEFVDGFAEAIPEIVVAIAEAAPVFIEALVENLPTLISALVKAAPDIIRALTLGIGLALRDGIRKAFEDAIPDIRVFQAEFSESFKQLADDFAVALTSSIFPFFKGLGAAFTVIYDAIAAQFEPIGQVFEDSFSGPLQILAEIFTGLISNVGNFITGIGNQIAQLSTDILNAFLEPLREFSSRLLETFLDPLREFGPRLLDTLLEPLRKLAAEFEKIIPDVDVGSGTGGVLGAFRGAVGLATGGQVVGSGTRDSVPALLAPGELVIDRTTGPKLMDFINRQSGNGEGTEALLLEILQELRRPQNVSTTVEVDGSAFADIQLELSRRNERTR